MKLIFVIIMKSLTQYIVEALSETEIFEMAYDRKSFMNKAHNLARQIIENWCLVKYCTVKGNTILTKEHWKTELSSYLFDLFEDELTTNKKRALEDIWINKDEYVRTSKIKLLTKKKFQNEKFKLDDDYEIVCDAFVEDLHTIIELISNKLIEENYDKLEDYIENL